MDTYKVNTKELTKGIKAMRNKLYQMEGFSPVEKITPVKEQIASVINNFSKNQENVKS